MRHVVEACLASTDFIAAWGTHSFNENQINLSYLVRPHSQKNSTPNFWAPTSSILWSVLHIP